MEQGIVVSLKCYWFWQTLFWICNPVVEIDGQQHSLRWKKYPFALASGYHHIRIFFPYFLNKQCGMAEIAVDLKPGQTVEIDYSPPFTIFQPGNLKTRGMV